MVRSRIWAAVVAAGLLAGVAQAAETERYLILDNDGGKAGDLVVTREGARAEIVWDSKNNGRGTETRETLEIGAGGLPRAWRIETKTDLGGAGGSASGQGLVTFTEASGKASWSIDGKTGEQAGAAGAIFAPQAASPWALGLYARNLMQRPGMTAQALPGGQLTLEKTGEETVAGVKVLVWRLRGPEAREETLRLDASGALVAVGDGRVVRVGAEDVAKALREAKNAREEALKVALQAHLLHSFDGPVRVRNVRVFDPVAGALGAPSSVVFQDGRITAVEPLARPAAGETVIEGEGGALIPGLHDTHFHASLSGAEGFWLSLAAGVTTMRDMGSQNDFMRHYMQQVAAGRLPGGRILPGGMIEGESPFSLKSSGVLAATQQEALEAVRWYAANGYRQIKIYNSMKPEWIPAVTAEAHRLGMRVAGHIPAFTTPDRMIEAGYDEMTHGNQLMLGWVLKPDEDTRSPLRLTAMSRFADLDLQSPAVQKTLDAMQAKGVAFEPTLAIMRRLLMNRTGEVEDGDRWWFDHLPKPFRPGGMITVMPGFTVMPIQTPEDDAAYDAAAVRMIELVRMMKARGIRILPGSDDNNGFVIRRELDLMADAGMTPVEVLRLATLETAQYLDPKADWGVIAPGKSADFLLVPGDPTKGLDALHAVRMTVAQGRVYFPSEIYEAMGVKPFATPPAVQRASKAAQ